jgi:hypothetical protein
MGLGAPGLDAGYFAVGASFFFNDLKSRWRMKPGKVWAERPSEKSPIET